MDLVAASARHHGVRRLGGPALSPADYAAAPRCPVDLPKNRALFWEEDEPATFALLIDGVIRASRISEDGARQILAFFYPGEIVGLDPCARRIYTAETVTPCRVQRFRRAHGASDTASADVGAHWADVLDRVLRLASLIAHRSVVARVAWFLLELRSHLSPGAPGGFVRFDIPRADIADHLATAVETVCRTLTDFRTRGLIAMPNRQLLGICDPAALHALARGEVSRIDGDQFGVAPTRQHGADAACGACRHDQQPAEPLAGFDRP